ncbi:hypothetical protein [Mucilaginibacter phyllosphaerae]|uniref:Ribosomal protein L17 n=1 Tax=Mucilaginibacter phyllosphaerae TaxID=1812349 RepID=A0ABR6IDT9_9SPHI|nr:hypothetical protein [Mucilaginibacter phyllosphaerae]MBB3971206.1 ribosomal protein L17 [Mucilaginibacter phyllosphaerae]GGH12588.1 hypothetical protein GCM10007352_19450 [Mucilaginibacter phyllosphaerae]
MGDYPHQNKRRISNEKVIKILKENGITATEEQAKEILNFLYLLADLAIKKYFNEK